MEEAEEFAKPNATLQPDPRRSVLDRPELLKRYWSLSINRNVGPPFRRARQRQVQDGGGPGALQEEFPTSVGGFVGAAEPAGLGE